MLAGNDALLPDCRVPVSCFKGAVCVVGEAGVGGHVSRRANFGKSAQVRALVVSSRWPASVADPPERGRVRCASDEMDHRAQDRKADGGSWNPCLHSCGTTGSAMTTAKSCSRKFSEEG